MIATPLESALDGLISHIQGLVARDMGLIGQMMPDDVLRSVRRELPPAIRAMVAARLEGREVEGVAEAALVGALVRIEIVVQASHLPQPGGRRLNWLIESSVRAALSVLVPALTAMEEKSP